MVMDVLFLAARLPLNYGKRSTFGKSIGSYTLDILVI